MSVIKEILASRKMSQNQLGRAANIPASSISYIISGKLSPGPTWRHRIAEALAVPEEVLFPKEVK